MDVARRPLCGFLPGRQWNRESLEEGRKWLVEDQGSSFQRRLLTRVTGYRRGEWLRFLFAVSRKPRILLSTICGHV